MSAHERMKAAKAALEDARAKRDSLAAQLTDIHERANGGELSPGQAERWQNLERGLERANAEVDAARDTWAAAATDYASATPGALQDTNDALRVGDDSWHVMKRTPSPWSSENRDADLVRARQAAERVPDATDSARDDAVRLLERAATAEGAAHLPNVERHILDTSRPAYVRAFQKFLAEPMSYGRSLSGEEAAAVASVNQWHGRAAMSLTGANGGFLVPQFLDPTVNITSAGRLNDVRKAARIEQVTVDQWDGVNSAGVSAEWLAEGSEAADATPTFTAPTITNHKAAAWVYGSVEVLADSGFESVNMLIADAFDILEADAFISGTGSGQPFGLVTQLSGTGPSLAGSSGAAGAADLVVADIYAMSNNLPARWHMNASWLGHHSIYNSIRQLNTDAAGSTFWVDLGSDRPAELIGRPTYLASAMDSTVVSGSNDDVLLLGDMRQYVITDRLGTTLLYEPLVKGSNQRPTGQAGWFAFKRTGADVLTSNAFKLLRL